MVLPAGLWLEKWSHSKIPPTLEVEDGFQTGPSHEPRELLAFRSPHYSHLQSPVLGSKEALLPSWTSIPKSPTWGAGTLGLGWF